MSADSAKQRSDFLPQRNVEDFTFPGEFQVVIV